MPGVVLGYVLAGNPLFDVRALGWALFGLLFHAWGFLQNNIFDYQYDKKDPSKAHHPLVKGEITLGRALALDVILLLGMIFYMMLISGGNPFSHALLALAIMFGTLYNYYCKKTTVSPLYITACFTTLVFIPYVAYTLTITPVMWLLAAFTSVLMLFQISVSGYIKEIAVGSEVNLLRRWGSRLDGDHLKLSLQADVYALVLTALKGLLIAFIAVTAGTAAWAFIGALVATVGFFYFSGFLISEGPFYRPRRVRQMSLAEVLSYFALVFAVEGVVGWLGVAALIVLPMAWFMGMNKVMWLTVVTPRV